MRFGELAKQGVSRAVSQCAHAEKEKLVFDLTTLFELAPKIEHTVASYLTGLWSAGTTHWRCRGQQHQRERDGQRGDRQGHRAFSEHPCPLMAARVYTAGRAQHAGAHLSRCHARLQRILALCFPCLFCFHFFAR